MNKYKQLKPKTMIPFYTTYPNQSDRKFLKILFISSLILFIANTIGFGQIKNAFTTAGTYTWTAPQGVASVYIDLYGGGGAGGGSADSGKAGGGGGGGSYIGLL